MGTTEEPVRVVEGASSVTHHGTVLQSACTSSWRHRTNCGPGEEERETILEELPLVLVVATTSVQLFG